jgi:phenylalanyl-tRNA synthetase beta chain
MTILSMNKKELESKIGRVDEKMQKLITDMGTPIEYVNDDDVAVEVFPNRPDLLSLGNFARAVMQYRGKRGFFNFKINPPEKDYDVIIDKSVKGVRNHTVCCIVKGLKFNDEKIKEIIDIQEKLHNSLGRKRKKAAIGIYPLEKIKLPIKFIALDPKDVKFVPLDFPREISAKQILSKHPTGREYGDLLKGFLKFPFFVDSDNNVLSMPPIINSEKTGRISLDTKEIFIECSGDNLYYLKKILAIIVSSLYEMGAKIYSMNIIDKKDGSFVSPLMNEEEMHFSVDYINQNLGLSLSEKEIRNYLWRMGIGYKYEKKNIVALIPAYRTDILHPIDLVEEVAIAYGYDNFEPIIPSISTIGEEDKSSRIKRVISDILSGAGLLEVSSFHLTTKKNTKKIYFDFLVEDFIELEDSKTERDVLRTSLLTCLMQVFSENSDSLYPQKIFEIGKVFEKDVSKDTGIKEIERLAISIVDEKVTFTEIKQISDYLFKMLGLKYNIEDDDSNSAFINGRCGKIIVNERPIGFIGEIAPRVLKNFKIKAPCVAMEIDLDFLINC